MIWVSVAIVVVSSLYAIAGQAGGTAFLAIMGLAGFAPNEMRPTALLLNIVAAGYATWLLHRKSMLKTRLVLQLTLPSLVTAFLGGLVALRGDLYFVLTGTLLLVAAALMVIPRPEAKARTVSPIPFAALGAVAGYLSGITGIGGGVFVTPFLIVAGWTSTKRAVSIAPPFILCNSVLGLLGALLAGQTVTSSAGVYALAALLGAFAGTALAHRWASDKAIKYLLAAILLFSGLRMIVS